MGLFSGRRNVGETERIASAVGGGALVLNAMRKPTTMNVLLGLGGLALLQRAVTGHCALKERLGIGGGDDFGERGPRETYGRGKRGSTSIRDEVENASEHSFPASDPPSWIPTSAIGHPAV